MITCLGKSCSFGLPRKLLSIYVFSYFPFGFEGRIWDLIVSVPDHLFTLLTLTYFLLSDAMASSSEIFEQRHEKTCFSHMRTTKMQISLHMHAI